MTDAPGGGAVGATRSAVAGAVLAGGASRRMGVDKATLAVDGRPMGARVAEALRSAGCEPVWFQGGHAAALGALGFDAISDDAPGTGPVPAVVTSLRHARAVGATSVAVAGCDLVDLDAVTVHRLIEVAGAQHRVAVATTGEQPHLVAVWPVACEPALVAYVADGGSAFRGALQAVGAVAVDVDPAAVRNVNRPGDLGPGGYPPQR